MIKLFHKFYNKMMKAKKEDQDYKNWSILNVKNQ